MKPRIFFFLSLVLVAFALCSQLGSLHQIARGFLYRAKAVNVVEGQRPALRLEADRFTRRGTGLGVAGLVLAVLSLAFLIASQRRHEPARLSVAYTLLAFYVMSLLVLAWPWLGDE